MISSQQANTSHRSFESFWSRGLRNKYVML